MRDEWKIWACIASVVVVMIVSAAYVYVSKRDATDNCIRAAERTCVYREQVDAMLGNEFDIAMCRHEEGKLCLE